MVGTVVVLVGKFFTITATDVVVRRMTKEDELFSTDIFISKCPVGPQDTVKNYNKQKRNFH